jgi:hypothetical protein
MAQNAIFEQLHRILTTSMECEISTAIDTLQTLMQDHFDRQTAAMKTYVDDLVGVVVEGLGRAEDLRRLDPESRAIELKKDLEARAVAEAVDATLAIPIQEARRSAP